MLELSMLVEMAEREGGVMKRCPNYTGVTCVNGNCPIALSDKYEEYGIPITNSCNNCFYYKGCEDCCFCGENGCEIEQKLTEFQKNSEKEVE